MKQIINCKGLWSKCMQQIYIQRICCWYKKNNRHLHNARTCFWINVKASINFLETYFSVSTGWVLLILYNAETICITTFSYPYLTHIYRVPKKDKTVRYYNDDTHFSEIISISRCCLIPIFFNPHKTSSNTIVRESSSRLRLSDICMLSKLIEKN